MLRGQDIDGAHAQVKKRLDVAAPLDARLHHHQEEHIGSQPDRKQALEDATRDVGLITGQKAVSMLSKKAISNFKLRAGSRIGCKVTLFDLTPDEIRIIEESTGYRYGEVRPSSFGPRRFQQGRFGQ